MEDVLAARRWVGGHLGHQGVVLEVEGVADNQILRFSAEDVVDRAAVVIA